MPHKPSAADRGWTRRVNGVLFNDGLSRAIDRAQRGVARSLASGRRSGVEPVRPGGRGPPARFFHRGEAAACPCGRPGHDHHPQGDQSHRPLRGADSGRGPSPSQHGSERITSAGWRRVKTRWKTRAVEVPQQARPGPWQRVRWGGGPRRSVRDFARLAAWLAGVLAQLSDSQRAVLELRYANSPPAGFEEIGGSLGISTEAARVNGTTTPSSISANACRRNQRPNAVPFLRHPTKPKPKLPSNYYEPIQVTGKEYLRAYVAGQCLARIRTNAGADGSGGFRGLPHAVRRRRGVRRRDRAVASGTPLPRPTRLAPAGLPGRAVHEGTSGARPHPGHLRNPGPAGSRPGGGGRLRPPARWSA